MHQGTPSKLAGSNTVSNKYAEDRLAAERWLSQESDSHEAMARLCQLADQSQDYPHAADWLCRSLEKHPDHHRACAHLGYVMCRLDQWEAGLECYDKAIAINAGQPMYFYERAAALAHLDRHARALPDYERALALDPGFANAYAHYGTSLACLGQQAPALAAFDRAIALDQRCTAAWVNRANAYLKNQAFASALADYDRAIALQPGHAIAHANRGAALKHLHRIDEALAATDRAIALDPGYADAQFNKALLLLLKGELREGFRLYQVRWQTKAFAPILRGFQPPLWLGEENIAGKRLLVHNEQGLGDSIQFSRFVTLAARLGAQVIYEVEPALFDLFGSLEGVHTLVQQRQMLPPFDLYCPVMTLPAALGTTLADLSIGGPYLQAPAERRAQWARRLGDRAGLRVGLVWSGNPLHQGDAQRSIALQDLSQALPQGLQCFSLQKELREGDAQFIASSGQLRHFGAELVDFSDTAALCSHMDLVIAVDTSVAHLAGALGIETCLLLPFTPDWRWLLHRHDSPWYPRMHLFRQEASGDWTAVLQRIGALLEQRTR